LTDAFRRPQDFVSRDRPGGIGLPELGILAGRYDSGGSAGSDCVMALAGVEGTIGGDAADLLFGGIVFGGHEDCRRDRHDAAALAHLEVGRVEPDIGLLVASVKLV
jgi:hypothetical protein